MKGQEVLVASKSRYIDLKIARFLKVGRSFVVKICKELEATNFWVGDCAGVASREKLSKGSANIRTLKCVRKVQ